MSYTNSEAFKAQQFLSTLELIESKGHAYVSGDYETKQSSLTVLCQTHQLEHTTTLTNYRRSKTGTLCCARAKVSQNLRARHYSAETIEKMRKAALERVSKIGSIGSGQDWRRSKKYMQWYSEVRQDWHNECAITGEKSNLVFHHFFSGARSDQDLTCRNVLLYHRLNGIVLYQPVHVDFHKMFGYEKNTFSQFQSYVQQLQKLISSQALEESGEGSETRVNDPTPSQDKPIDQRQFELSSKTDNSIDQPRTVNISKNIVRGLQIERIMKLHERLEEIRNSINDVIGRTLEN